MARTHAEEFLRGRDTGWRAAVTELRSWLAASTGLPAREASLARLKAARGWLKEAGAAIRDERVAPFAAHSQRIWEQLRQESNVELGTVTLAGTNTRRRVVFPVSVDGSDNGTALGVTSQGEMHALGLATFLPRSCAEESPFRFVIVDDPVQSMDPSKVDNLARVLAELAEHRQVVVFTHDTRLPDAVHRLDLGRTRIVEVHRAEQSVVTLRPAPTRCPATSTTRARCPAATRCRPRCAGRSCGAVPLGGGGCLPPAGVADQGGARGAARRDRGGGRLVPSADHDRGAGRLRRRRTRRRGARLAGPAGPPGGRRVPGVQGRRARGLPGGPARPRRGHPRPGGGAVVSAPTMLRSRVTTPTPSAAWRRPTSCCAGRARSARRRWTPAGGRGRARA